MTGEDSRNTNDVIDLRGSRSTLVDLSLHARMMTVGRWPVGAGIYLAAISWGFQLIDERFDLTWFIIGLEVIVLPVSVWIILRPAQAASRIAAFGEFLER